jgi:uncharacterized membrane protein YqjE
MESPSPSVAANRPGLLAGVGGLLRNLLGLLMCRLELAALELAEAKAAAVKMALVALLGVLAAWFALAYWSGLIVVLAWDSLGWKILAILGGVFTLLATLAVWYVKAMLAQGRLSLPATMAELRNDRDALL